MILSLSVICAETTKKAEDIAFSTIVWELQKEKGEGKDGVPSLEEAKIYASQYADQASIERIKSKMIIGNPEEVVKKLRELQCRTKADELMIITITHAPRDKHKSYELLASQWMNKKSS